MGRNTQNDTKCYLSKYVLFLSTFWWVKKKRGTSLRSRGNQLDFEGKYLPLWFLRNVRVKPNFNTQCGGGSDQCYSLLGMLCALQCDPRVMVLFLQGVRGESKLTIWRLYESLSGGSVLWASHMDYDYKPEATKRRHPVHTDPEM